MKDSISILSVLIALAIVPSTGCAAVSKPNPSPVSKNKPKPGTVLWEFTAEEGEPFHNSVVISKSGDIFAASATYWYALDSRTGKAKRKLNMGRHIMAMSVTADSCLLSGRGGDSRAINSDTGKQVWQSSKDLHSAYGAAALNDGIISYFGDTVTRKVVALNYKTGKVVWNFLTKNGVSSGCSVGNDGTVYVGGHDGVFYAFEGKTGSLRWKYDSTDVHSYEAIHRGHSDMSAHQASIGKNGIIYTSARRREGGGLLLALNGATGEKIWHAPIDHYTNTPIIDEAGDIVMGDRQGHINVFNGQNGKLKWKSKKPVRGSINTSVVIGEDGMIYFGSDDRYIRNG